MRNKSRLFERPEEKAYELGDDEEEDDLQGEERQAVIKRIVPKHDAIGVDLGGRVTGQVRRRKRLHGMAAPDGWPLHSEKLTEKPKWLDRDLMNDTKE